MVEMIGNSLMVVAIIFASISVLMFFVGIVVSIVGYLLNFSN